MNKPITNLSLVFIVFLFFWTFKPEKAVQWNIANTFFLQALYARSDSDILTKVERAIEQFRRFPLSERAKKRLLQLYPAQWKAASSLDNQKLAIQAYKAGQQEVANIAKTDCSPQLGRFEAEDFLGIAPGSLSVSRLIDNRMAVLLFSSSPITQSVCLPSEGSYEITVVARENTPTPIILSVFWDGWLAGTLKYADGDGEWSARSVKIISPEGKHILELVFTNDYYNVALNVDRNAMIDYVMIDQPARSRAGF